MNHFEALIRRGNSTPYLRSPQFLERTNGLGLGKQGIADAVNVLCVMLQRVSLDPRRYDEILSDLEAGIVSLSFLDILNPVPSFELPCGSTEHATLTRAVTENRASRLFNAAQRVQLWRDRRTQFRAWADRAVGAFSASLPWEQFRHDKVGYASLIEQRDKYRRSVWSRRFERLHQLSSVAGASVGFYDLLEDLANTALPQ